MPRQSRGLCSQLKQWLLTFRKKIKEVRLCLAAWAEWVEWECNSVRFRRSKSGFAHTGEAAFFGLVPESVTSRKNILSHQLVPSPPKTFSFFQHFAAIRRLVQIRQESKFFNLPDYVIKVLWHFNCCYVICSRHTS